MRIGCHLSVSNGFSRMAQTARELGADVAQYFPKNPKSYRVKVFDAAALRAEAKLAQELDIMTVCHSPYVTNLATPDAKLQELSVVSIVNDLEIADAYNTPYLIVHCGKHVGVGEEQGLELMRISIDQVLARYQGDVMLLIENTAGQGSEMGRYSDELLAIRAVLEQPERVGFCFDVCHAFAAGAFSPQEWERTHAELSRHEFSHLVKVAHLNDSLTPYNNRRDRHALLGTGEIGKDGLQRFLSNYPFADAPIIIETPVEAEQDYANEIKLARQWAQEIEGMDR